MTDKDALACIEDVLGSTVRYDESLEYELTSYDVDWLEKAKEAVEKQMPKKPDFEGDGYDENGNIIYDTWICPCCEEHYEVDYDNYKYCPNCGQAIRMEE